jgi:hypothetical protein
MLFAVVGIFFLLRNKKGAFWPILIFTIINIYVQSCWWCWWFGGGYSIRVFIDSYGILALPLANLIYLSSKHSIMKYALPGVLLILTWYNTFQIQQFRNNAIHWWWNNKEAYWENFLKKKPTHEYWDLVRVPDYYKARKGEYEAITVVEKNRRDLWRKFRDRHIRKLKRNKQLMDSLKQEAYLTKSELETALKSIASEEMNIVLNNKKEKLEEKINEKNSWKKFLRRKAKQLEVPYDSSMRLEIDHLINSQYD